MGKRLNILILTNELKITCGVSSALNSFLSNIPKDSNMTFYLGCGGGDAVDKFRPLVKNLFVKDYLKHENRSFINFIKNILFIFSFCRRNRIDIIHSHTHYAANIAHIVAKLTGRKTVQSIHGIIDEIGIIPHYIADKYIAVNEHIIKYFQNKKERLLGKTFLIRCGYNFPEKCPKRTNEIIKFILGSRLIYEKGIDIYINAIKVIPDSLRSRCEFFIAGEGKDERTFREMAKGYNIVFLGSVPDFDNFLLTTDVFIIPTRSRSEGFPTSIIQAAKSGNLVISSDFFGVNEVLKHNHNALIFNTEDYIFLSRVIQDVIEKSRTYEEMVETNFYESKNLFDLMGMIHSTFELYSSL